MSDRHGTYLGYQVDGCRCRPCTNAAVTWDAHWRLRSARGQVWTDATDVTAAIAGLVDAGVTPSALATAAATSGDNAARALSGTGRIATRIADRIVAVTMDDLPGSAKVNMTVMVGLVDRLAARGMCRYRIGQDVFGWVRWPGERWLLQDRVTLRLVRAAELVLASCEDCVEEAYGGGRWCLSCLDGRQLPTGPDELEDRHRRRLAASTRAHQRRQAKVAV